MKHPNNNQHESKSGNKPSKDRPWCWCEKDALEMITEAFSEADQLSSARSVYLALCQLRSDKRSDTFKVNKALIAHKAGLSVSTVQRLLKHFERLHLVAITRNRLGAFKQANTYTLLPIGNGDASIGNGAPLLNPDKVKEEERIKKNQNTIREGTTHGAQTTSKNGEVFEGKEKGSHGKNKLQDNSGILDPKKKGAKIPIAQRNKIINRLNVKKQSIYRDSSLTPEERERALAKVDFALQKL